MEFVPKDNPDNLLYVSHNESSNAKEWVLKVYSMIKIGQR